MITIVNNVLTTYMTIRPQRFRHLAAHRMIPPVPFTNSCLRLNHTAVQLVIRHAALAVNSR